MTKRTLLLAAFSFLISASLVAAAPPKAEKYLSSAMNVFSRVENGNVTGESFCWHAAFNLRQFVMGYKAYGDTAWLDCGVKYYDRLMAVRAVGPGGYKGFIGPYIYDGKVWGDVHVADAIIYRGLLDFAELVLGDQALEKTYGERARFYVAEAEKHLFEKWESRGTWRQDGPFGGYVSWTHYGRPGQFADWTDTPALTKGGLSLPFNKQNDMAECYLILFRLTGRQVYQDRAVSIFSFMRSRMQAVDGRFQWNYWEPLGPWDIAENGRGFNHWINTHPYRNYQAGEVGQVCEAYDSGVVFSERDIRRIIKTNLDVMWNGSLEKPEFVNSNVRLPGYRKPSASSAYPTWAGTLWSSLAPYDKTIREIQRALWAEQKASGTHEQINRDYFEKVICAEAPSFERHHAAEGAMPIAKVNLQDFTHESPELMFVAALPAEVETGGEMNLCCTAYVPGEVAISVYPAIYKGVRGMPMTPPVIYKGSIGRPLIHTWNLTDAEGKPLAPGNYVVRWSFKDGYREMPIFIK